MISEGWKAHTHLNGWIFWNLLGLDAHSLELEFWWTVFPGLSYITTKSHLCNCKV